MEKDMTVGKPGRLILLFTIPLIIGNIFQQLYSMVDTIIVGRYVGVSALASVGLTGPMSFLILGFVMGLTGGFAVIVAQRFGAKDEDGLRHAVAISIYLCVFFTIVLTAIGMGTAKIILIAMNTPEDVLTDAYIYIMIIFAGIGATFLYNMIACILRALGDSRTPLYFLIFSSIVNIVLDLVLIINFNMGVAGAGIATVISQGLSGILCVIYTKRKYPILKFQKKDFRFDWTLIQKHLTIGLPMAFQFSITAVGVIILQGALNLFGADYIAGFTAANKVEQLVSQPANSFGTTMANYTGQNLGAGKYERIKEGTRKCSIITLAFAVLAALIVFYFGKDLTLLFVKEGNAKVLKASREYLNTIAVFLPVLSLLFVYRNVLQGMGRSFVPLMAGVAELVARTIGAITFPAILGFVGICIAGPFAWILATIPLAIAYFTVMKRIGINSSNK
ncbi:MATE family efflux transporter [Velocimicrobium porci]|uniref:MATE family efflux transporter n=1 Tax=Velocimicrobium porci TaxID=2606634 RepID=A0A6L5XW48_9FIRM|nr:MATE family efflux transporter [Velocimicrobium porci]MSS63060.1 MATE family efflux transporter [Velocimicrobium porci]